MIGEATPNGMNMQHFHSCMQQFSEARYVKELDKNGLELDTTDDGSQGVRNINKKDNE